MIKYGPSLMMLALLAGCASEPTPIDVQRLDATLLQVPVTQADGSVVRIVTRLCIPDGGARRPLVVINHGSPPQASQRPGMSPTACGHEAVRFFTARGHAVGLPLRRGYGASGGRWAEAYGNCNNADFYSAGLESARDIRAAISVLTARPDVPTGPVLVVGQSAGGWGAIALASLNPPEVGGFVNMAGGRGGWRDNTPSFNCSPERLVEAAGRFGKTARQPMLWVYTANDTFFAPELAQRMHQAFTAGGGQARLVALGPQGRDGHSLFFGPAGSQVWGPLVVEAFP